MKNWITRLLVLCYFSLLLSSAASGDAAVMYAIAKSLVGVPSDWQTEQDPCSWYGIKCTGGQVTSIDLNSKSISGTLPDSVSQLSSLTNLDLGHNQISGPIPSLAGLSALQTLDLAENAFTSVSTNLFSGLTGLQSITLDNNPLTPWSVPIDLAQCIKIHNFSAANSSIIGSIPEFFGQLPTLKVLRLSYNNLIGWLPSSFAGSSIESLSLNDQQPPGLSGMIDVIGSMPQLQLVWLQSNNFTGPIPDLSNLALLASFNVRDNQLTGPVPWSLTSSETLKNVMLSNNMLQGPFPNFSGSITVDVNKGNQFCNTDPGPCDPRVTALLSVAGGFGYPLELANSWKGNDLCSNQLTGVIGVTCDTKGEDIMVLNFSGKHYIGTISPSISKLTSLTQIILSNNNLTGPIPDSLTILSQLQLLDVTNNNLTGEVPDFLPSVSLKTSGNPMLRRYSNPGPSGDGGSGSSGSSSSHSAEIWGLIPVILILICFLACLIYYKNYINRTKKISWVQKRRPSKEQETVKIIMSSNMRGLATSGHNSINAMIEAPNLIFPFQDLQEATNDFSEDNILGRGRFCVVYKGNHNGTMIAVKRNVLDIICDKRMEEFRAEINVWKKVRHRYLVSFLGYCVNKNERLLVYEYMPEGTLGQRLFDRNENKCSALNWNQRLMIALDVARGIEYLHDLAQECFIHRDLNPSNILLDKDLRAKVSNFGLVKLVDSGESIQTRLAGTFGYLAPEYAITGKISTKVDVYAFGVILMELITGRRAINESLPVEVSHLVNCFHRNILDKKFMDYVDPTLDLDEEAHSSMSHVAELACHCTAHESNQRPDMGHIVNMLVPFVEKWNPSLSDDEANYNHHSSTTLADKLRKWQFDDDTSITDLFRSNEGSQHKE